MPPESLTAEDRAWVAAWPGRRVARHVATGLLGWVWPWQQVPPGYATEPVPPNS